MAHRFVLGFYGTSRSPKLAYLSSRCVYFSAPVAKEVDNSKTLDVTRSDLALPEEPTNCCMSGCANCVWIKYAEEVLNGFDGGSDLVRKTILEKVEDPNMKAFLEMELRALTNK